MKLLNVLALTLVLAFAYNAKAVDTPSTDDGGCKVVSADEVNKLKATVAIYDVRPAAEYAEEHLPGAKNLPYKEKSKKEAAFDASMDEFDHAKLPDAGAILACNGNDCWKSYKACIVASKHGKKNLYRFRGGLPEWKAKGLPTEK